MVFRTFGTIPHILYILLSMDAYQNNRYFYTFQVQSHKDQHPPPRLNEFCQ